MLRLGSKSQSRRCFYLCGCGCRFLHVPVQNTAPAAGRDNCALCHLKGKGIFLLMGVQGDRGNFGASMWVLGIHR